jgi:hypothetical protein
MLDPEDIVLFVGPNNAGKSVALSELQLYLGQSSEQTVIKHVELRRTGNPDSLRTFLQANSLRNTADSYSGYGFSIPDDAIDTLWTRTSHGLVNLFCTHIPTHTRLFISNPAPSIALLSQPPQHPIHLLYVDGRLERRFSSYFRRAFGKDLNVFHGGGAEWPLLVGDRPEPERGEDRISVTYLDPTWTAGRDFAIENGRNAGG